MSKKTFIHAENNNKILSSNEVKLYVPPEPEKMKVIIWGKELCNGAEWYDFLKCVEEKTRENDQLKQQLEEKDKEIEKLKQQYTILENENGKLTTELIMDKYKKAQKEVSFGKQLAIQELEKVKNYCDKQFNLWENNNFNETYDNTDVSHAYFEIAFIIKEKIKELKGE